jgi:hypothetical protein
MEDEEEMRKVNTKKTAVKRRVKKRKESGTYGK